ncbi:MAG: hypothetical protein V4539_13820 [Bacteroidota bacterium]
MKNNKLLAYVFLLFLTGCTGSKITTVWKAADITSQSYGKILVLGLIPEKDRRIQENMENHVAGDLIDLGYSAVTSLQLFGPKAFDQLDENAALEKLKNSGISAVITIVMLDKKKERKYVQPQVTYSSGGYMNNFWEYRLGLYNRILEPGYYITDTKYYWESNFYEMSSRKLIYSVQTQSFDPKNSWSMGHEYGHMIVNNMVREKILKTQGRIQTEKF